MSVEELTIERRAAAHAALGDAARLRIVDRLRLGDAAPSELAALLGMPSNLLAHHLRTLERSGLVVRQRSEGDGRRTYLRLVPSALDLVAPASQVTPARVVFVCTANSARSQLATALWRRTSRVSTASAGTHPADRIAAEALATARRHGLPLPRRRPLRLEDVLTDGDLLVTVCDRAHEELGERSELHWSIPDPVRVGTATAFDAAFDDISARVTNLAGHLRPAS